MQSEKELITQVINAYFKGTYYGDAQLLKNAFHPAARITGLFENNYCDWSLDEFITRVTIKPTASENNDPYNKKIIFLEITNNAAIAKATVTVNGVCFTDFITLLKINEHWVIRNKSFTTN